MNTSSVVLKCSQRIVSIVEFFPNVITRPFPKRKDISRPLDTSITQLTVFIREAQQGHVPATDMRWPFVYQKLRSIATRLMHAERPDHTLSVDGLVHETYLRLFPGQVDVENREHFFRLFTRAMKRTLIDYARNRNALKRQGRKVCQSLNEALHVPEASPQHHEEDLKSAIDRLAQIDPRLAQVIELRFFQQMPIEEMATELQVSTRTIDRNLKRAKMLLFHALMAEYAPQKPKHSA